MIRMGCASRSSAVPADPWIVLGACLAEGATGYSRALHARVPHPVAWLAGLIAVFDRTLNRPGAPAVMRRAAGALTLALVAGLAGAVGFGLERALAGSLLGAFAIGLLGAFGIAARSLYDHVEAVRRALAQHDLAAAREAVGRIVGRDVSGLDAAGVSAAALESLAESTCDGVIAPVFWFLVGGLGGLFAYKAVNTADSLIGHKEAPYTDFGWASARADDLMNFIPARLSGALICLTFGRGWRVMRKDARRHASPNAGWPEAAMAGALAVRLGGAVSYGGAPYERPFFGRGPAPGPAELARGLRGYVELCAVLAAFLFAGGLLWPR
jgi:adenosylcobinamide-phosphate synthase